MSQDPLIARRDLLRNGTLLIGGAAVGVLPGLAEAADLLTSQKVVSDTSDLRVAAPAAFSLGYWNGGRFVAAETLASADASLEAVRLTITSSGGGGFSALDAHAPVPGVDRVPFTAWVSPPSGAKRTRSRVVVEADGLVLAPTAGGHRSEVRLGTGRAAGPKLREGTYILVPGKADLNGFTLNEKGEPVSRRAGAPFVVLLVERD